MREREREIKEKGKKRVRGKKEGQIHQETRGYC